MRFGVFSWPFTSAMIQLYTLEKALCLASASGATVPVVRVIHVVVADPLVEPWGGEIGGRRRYDRLRHEVEIRDRMVRLAQRVVIGTHARAGVQGILLGNTSARLLHAIAADVLTVPGPAYEETAQ
jgi:hypothetical protein